MKITILGVLIFILSLVLIGRSLWNIKHEKMGFRSGIIWVLMWAGIGFFSIFPEFLDKTMLLVQMKNRMLFILIIAVCVLFTIIFNLASRMDNIQRDLTKLAREIAIVNYKLENNDERKDEDETVS
ncbi:DUF2304 family protein [Thermodesulfobacteriota bacterium]